MRLRRKKPEPPMLTMLEWAKTASPIEVFVYNTPILCGKRQLFHATEIPPEVMAHLPRN